MYAYDEIYLEDARSILGEMFEYAVYDLHYELEEFFGMFADTHVARMFEMGNPKYVTGMSGIELARCTIHEVKNEWIQIQAGDRMDRSPEYWTGWIMAYYQHQRNISFKRMDLLGLSAEFVCSRYILHEADDSKFLEVADHVIREKLEQEENRLKRLRMYAGMTQKELSEKSGVTLRMIQLYEQGQNDISKAQAKVVLMLSKALHCEVEDLL